jgi:hypothetical protein
MNSLNQVFPQFLPSKTRCRLLAACLFATALCGCFQATNKFYLDSDITTDKRFEGRFRTQGTNQNSSAGDSLIIQPDRDKHYVATYQEGENWIRIDAVLFKSGTNLFVDISHLADNGAPHNPGGAPSGLDLLRLATREKTHSAIRVQFAENGVEFQFAIGNPVVIAISREPTLKMKVQGEGSVILLDSTDKLRAFLGKIGNENSFFQQKARWTRTAN